MGVAGGSRYHRVPVQRDCVAAEFMEGQRILKEQRNYLRDSDGPKPLIIMITSLLTINHEPTTPRRHDIRQLWGTGYLCTGF
jgi:hypothetical protein